MSLIFQKISNFFLNLKRKLQINDSLMYIFVKKCYRIVKKLRKKSTTVADMWI